MKYPLFKVKINLEDTIDRIKSVLSSGYLNEGVQVHEFRDALCDILDHKNITPTNSCTSAISMALRLSNVQPGDEVITTSMTCVATNTPIQFMGAKVVWADINSETGNIDPDQVRSCITPKTKAVICVNWAGNPCELEKLWRICRENNIKLIQDAAHALGSMYKEKHVCHFADYTCYSFQAIKHITCGDGGAIVCHSEEDHLRARAMKWFGIDRDKAKDLKGEWKGQRWEVDVEEAGHKFHMNNISATIGISNLASYEEVVGTHKRNGKIYDALFSESSSISPIKIESFSNSAYWVYTVILKDGINRDKIAERLNALGINAGLVHVPNHPYTCFKESLKDLPETDKFSRQQVSLPCGWWLKESDIEDIAKTLIEECERISG